MPLPPVEDFERVFRDDALWLGAIVAIADRHDLPGPWARPSGGSNVVFLGAEHVIKLFCPKWGYEASIESCAIRACDGRLPVRVPSVRAEGELEGWPYLVLARLPGRELGPIWGGLDESRQLRLVAAAAELLQALHAVPIPRPSPLPDARRILDRPLSAVLDKHRADGTDAVWVDAIAAQLGPRTPVWSSADALVHGDVRGDHMMVDDEVRLSGLIDFADTMIGPIEYDLAATACLMASHVAGGPAVFYQAYGLPIDALARERLGAALLRQRYCAMRFAFGAMPKGRRARSIAELVARALPEPDP